MILNKNQVDSLELLIKKEFSPLDISGMCQITGVKVKL
jgi:hypothetical protein